jgi:hypothetical protein
MVFVTGKTAHPGRQTRVAHRQHPKHKGRTVAVATIYRDVQNLEAELAIEGAIASA